MPKNKLVTFLDLADRILSYPTLKPKPVRFVVLYSRAHCRLVNAWVGRWEVADRAFPLLGFDDLPRKDAHGGGVYVRTPGPWELVVIEGGCKPLLEGTYPFRI